MKRHLHPKLQGLLLFFILASIPWMASAQWKLKGKVTDPRGNPIVGATISQIGGPVTTLTDETGSFSLPIIGNVANTGLSISHSGYRTQEASPSIGPDSVEIFHVTLVPDVLDLDEVVVTGNAVNTTKRKLGNSISTIQADQVKYAGTSNLSGLLNGRIMGGVVTQNSGDPGGGFSLKLRGAGSVFGSSEPLYIVDGVVVDNSSQNMVNLNIGFTSLYRTGNNRLVDINPHDIDHIEVINGPAAAAIYGSRASNGVVQIFTKKGRKGTPEVVLSTSVNHNSMANRIAVNNYPFRFGIRQSPRLDAIGDNRTMLFNFRPDKNAHKGGGPVSFSGELDTARYPVTRYDYQDDIFHSSWGTDQHISVSGGSDKGNYYMSGSYLDNDGILVGTGFRRYGLKMNVNYQLNDWISAGGGMMYSNSLSREKPNSILQFSPIGSMNHTDNVYDIRELNASGQLQAVEFAWMNPMSAVQTYDLSTETNRTLANAHLRLTPMKGLAISGTVGMDAYAQQGSSYQARLPYANVALGLFPDGYVSATKLNYQQWTTDLSASYSTTFGKYLSSSSVAGYSTQYIRTTYQAQEGRDLLPYVRTINAAQNLFSTPADQRTEQSIYGYFLQETIGYKDLLFLTLAGRFDGSSAFGASVGSIFYPKAGLSFSMSELGFWQKGHLHDWFNTLHLRASYGKAGNLTGIGPYDRFTTLSPFVYYNNVGGFLPPNRQGNEDIRPEIKSEWEAGADMQFLKGRLFLKATLYHQKITDIVMPYNWSPSNGSYSILGNLGSMENRGFEFMAGGSPVKTKGFSWDLSILLNRNRNKVISLYQNTNYIGFEGNNQGAVVGEPIGVYYGTYYARNPDGSLLLSKNTNSSNISYLLPQVERGGRVNGQPDGTPLNKVLGSPNPDYTATLVNEFRYGNWHLRIQLDRVAGFEMYNWTRIIRNNIGNGKMAERELKGELARGWVAAVGGQVNGPFIQEEAVEDASFTKIREASIGYTLHRLKGVKGMEFILSGRNLHTFTHYDGFDPETNTAGQSIIRGTDYGSYPIPRVVQFSIITTF